MTNKTHLRRFLCLVFCHHYGRDGRDSKKVDTKSVAIDFELFQNISTPDFTTNLLNTIDQFVKELNQSQTKGNQTILIRFSFLSLCQNTIIILDYSSNTVISDVKSTNIARIDTTDHAITIDISLEVSSWSFFYHRIILNLILLF